MKCCLFSILPLAFFALALPLYECPDCGGYLMTKAKTEAEDREGRLKHRYDLGCPGCGDRGIIGLPNLLFRRRVDRHIARLTRVAVWPHEDRDGDTEALQALATQHGEHPREYDSWGPGINRGTSFTGRYVHAGTVEYFLVALTPMSGSNLDQESPLRLILFDTRGGLVDRIDALCFAEYGRFEPRILPEAAADGAWVEIRVSDLYGAEGSASRIRVLLDRPISATQVELPATGRNRGPYRVGVHYGQLSLLSPMISPADSTFAIPTPSKRYR